MKSIKKLRSMVLVGLIAMLPFPSIASTNQLPSIQPPVLIDKQTTINLTEDIIIESCSTPFVATSTFAIIQPEKLLITSSTKNSIRITKNGIWDLTSFNNKNKIIEITGNTQLICEPGAQIIFNGGLLRFSGSSRWVIE